MQASPTPRRTRRLYLREPFSGLSHLFGAILSVGALGILITEAAGKPWHVLAFSVYGASLILLYMASAVYHLLPVDAEKVERLRAFDQAAIYFLIAGTYTPVCLVALRGPWGWGMLAAVWSVAIIGSTLRLTWKRKPEWLTFSLYLLMGWSALIIIAPLAGALRPSGMFWLLLGGLFYTGGAVILATDRPRLWPGKFGSHDLWHICVLSGSACHFVMMLAIIARAQ